MILPHSKFNTSLSAIVDLFCFLSQRLIGAWTFATKVCYTHSIKAPGAQNGVFFILRATTLRTVMA
jgi:hypothetical protein